MIEDLKDYLKDNGIFIASGIITEKKRHGKEALTNNGFKILEEKIVRIGYY